MQSFRYITRHMTLFWCLTFCTPSCFIQPFTWASLISFPVLFFLIFRDDLWRKQTKNWWRSCLASNRHHLCQLIWPLSFLPSSLPPLLPPSLPLRSSFSFTFYALLLLNFLYHFSATHRHLCKALHFTTLFSTRHFSRSNHTTSHHTTCCSKCWTLFKWNRARWRWHLSVQRVKCACC